ncbi:MAG: HAMP domain-containing protein (plasmid) [Candidatus Manganitrophus sp.]|nr:HAMP domain-containing protein [Candidatus Manganitrophus sp.]MDC4228182.1 HAMP domain-containing protein [Candidatus Manganitrophus sp.]WDT77732.1 MAG: HAMP domain-containing protein [Candidatus Manganitrophus sp.]
MTPQVQQSSRFGSIDRPTFRSRLFFKFIIPYIFLIVTVFSFSGWLFFSSASEALDAELSRRLVGVADLIARTVNPTFLVRIQPGDEETSLYRLILEELETIREATQVKDIHLFDRQNRVIVDLDGTQTIGEEDLLLQIDSYELDQVWRGRAVSSVLYRGRDSRFYKAGYAPLRDEQGRIIAGVGVEVGVDFMQIIDRVRRQFIGITLASGGFILLISFLLSRSMIRPIQILSSATEQIGKEGGYPQVDLKRNDELGDLGRHFNQMIGQIRTKDVLLRRMYDEERARAEVLEGYSQTLLKSIPSGVLGVNLKGEITSCNPAAENILGLSASSLLNRSVQGALCICSPLEKIIMTAVTTGSEAAWEEFPIEDPPRGKRWIGAMASPIKDQGGREIGATAVFADLTEVKNLQEEIALKRQMALLGELSAGMAHEIRNPLAAIQALGELLSRRVKGMSPRRDENMQVDSGGGDLEALSRDLVAEIGHLNRFVTEFLIYARMPLLRFEKTDLREIVDAALSLAAPQGRVGQIAVQYRVPDTLPEAPVDPLEFRRVLLNLIQNAFQAMGGKGSLALKPKRRMRILSCASRTPDPGFYRRTGIKFFAPFLQRSREGRDWASRFPSGSSADTEGA